jgi:2-keto-3-deoxy-L-rhamnonate aldolase RhmA
MKESFSKRLAEGNGLLGAWCTFASFASTEVMTSLGFDFLVLDLQHCELTQSQFPWLLGAFREGAPTAVVRAPSNDYHLINWLFDQGADAVLVPMVNSVEEARRAVDAAKFPPVGRRSFGPYRAAGYGAGAPAYMRSADQMSTLIIQLESADAARRAEEILSVPGIDAVFMGPNDLAFSMLKPGESFSRPDGEAEGAQQWTAFARTPEVLQLCEDVRKKAAAVGIPFGMTSGSMQEAREWLGKGAHFMTFGSDFLFLRAGARQMCGDTGARAAAISSGKSGEKD